MIAATTSPIPASVADRHPDYQELVLSTVITHRFLRAGSTVHHFLLAGDPDTTPVLVVGGRPDSWWSWHARIEALATRHYVIAPVLLLDESLRASQVVRVLDELSIDHVHVVADQDGAALVDQLRSVDGFRDRIVSSVCVGTGLLANLEDPDLTNRAIIEWLELREQTMGEVIESRRVGAHVPEGP